MQSQTTQKMMTMEDFLHQLKRHSLKATRQRILVHQAMMKLGHASADMVTEQIREDGNAKITTATVYNILSQFADMKIYGRRMSSNNKMYFDINSLRHLHLYDRENSRYRDIVDDELLEAVAGHLRKRRFKGYTIEDIDIQIIARPTKKSRAI